MDRFKTVSDIIPLITLKDVTNKSLPTFHTLITKKFVHKSLEEVYMEDYQLLMYIREGHTDLNLNWSPLHLAIYFNKTNFVKYFLFQRNESVVSMLRHPNNSSEDMFDILIKKKHLEVFTFLMNELSTTSYWTNERFQKVLQKCLK
jgi:hypothetical protein